MFLYILSTDDRIELICNILLHLAIGKVDDIFSPVALSQKWLPANKCDLKLLSLINVVMPRQIRMSMCVHCFNFTIPYWYTFISRPAVAI